MTEWKLTPEYLNENWTEEILVLMFIKRRERIEAVTKKVQPADQRLPNDVFFNKHNITIGKEL